MDINVIKEVINKFYDDEKINSIDLKLKDNSDICMFTNFIDSISIYYESLKVIYTEERYFNCLGTIVKSVKSSTNYYNIVDIVAITLNKQSEMPKNIDLMINKQN